MKQKQSDRSIGRPHNENFRERDPARRELSNEEFERCLQGLSDAAAVLLRFARERGLLPREADGKPRRVPLPRDR